MRIAHSNSRIKDPFLPPGPKGLPLLGSLIDCFSDMLGFLTRVSADYGDIVYYKLGSRKMYLLNNPEHIKDVLVTNNRNFEKSRALKRTKIILGEGLLTNEGEPHIKQRRTIQPVFHHERIKSYGDVMAQYASLVGEDWQNGAVVNIHKEMMKLTLNIVSKTIFDSDMESESEEIGKSLTDIVTLFPRLLFPYSEYVDNLPLPSNRRFQQAKDKLDSIIYAMIEERRARPGKRKDLLSMLLEAQDEEGDGDGMSDLQVRDEALTLFLAGQESTANSLVWTWYLVSQHPEVERKMQQEIDCVLKGSQPTLDDLGKLSYTQNVFKEALRLYPPAWAVARRVKEDYEVGGYVIPAGADIFMSQYVVHRDPRLYKEPDRFIPERWNSEETKNLPRFAYFPFGGGTRRCIGEPFAWMEGVILIATIASKWKMRLVPHQKIVPQALITIRPKNGMNMILERR
ncbi:MAG: cytochrome P450 [Deltaproteobacteria bacterium]|nr:cytochrome P450 [Deltaproteobacteria bacterium]